jgi:hypothetical protein
MAPFDGRYPDLPDPKVAAPGVIAFIAELGETEGHAVPRVRFGRASRDPATGGLTRSGGGKDAAVGDGKVA